MPHGEIQVWVAEAIGTAPVASDPDPGVSTLGSARMRAVIESLGRVETRPHAARRSRDAQTMCSVGHPGRVPAH